MPMLFLLASLLHCSTLAADTEALARPKLVLWITVDQLRADMPVRYLPPDSGGGFEYLARHGVSYTNAHYQYATTFTAVGHATLFTGGYPTQHGIVGNDWLDRTLGKSIDSVEDARYPLIGQPAGSGGGCSPMQLTSSTVADEILLAWPGRSRAYSISGKDRGAILPAGRLGKAFWFSKNTGGFVTSTYYGKAYPAWVAEWNAARPAERFREQVWDLKDPRATYLHADNDDRSCEEGYKHLDRTFPHPLATEQSDDFYSALTFTPFADELIVEFARELTTREGLGRGPATDLLALSLSATDQIGHAWGPESLEAEDNVRRVNALLGGLFEFIDAQVGLDKVLIVLSADHGMDDIPECAEARGLPAGRHDPQRFIATVNTALKQRLGIDRDLVGSFWNPSLYLDLEAVGRLNLDVAAVERATAEEIMKLPGFALALTRTDLLAGRVPDDPVGRRVQHSFHPTRSGNVLLVPAQFWYLYPEPHKYAAVHGSPWSYDTHVPVMIGGWRIRPAAVHRPVAPEDIAPTVAQCLGIKAPSGCIGQALEEVLIGPSGRAIAPR